MNKSVDEKKIWEGLYPIRHYVIGSMTILRIIGKDVTTGSTKIYTEALSVEKLQFISHVQIPLDKEILLGLQFTISDKVVEFKTKILGLMSNDKKKRYTYLVSFTVNDDKERIKILGFVNKIQLANKQKKLRNLTTTAVEIE